MASGRGFRSWRSSGWFGISRCQFYSLHLVFEVANDSDGFFDGLVLVLKFFDQLVVDIAQLPVLGLQCFHVLKHGFNILELGV